jgi:hypothetical protein
VPHFAIDPGPLAPADLARLARVFNAGRQVAAAYGVRAEGGDVQPRPTSRWARLGDRTSPSGRVLFRCGGCGRDSATCDKSCPAGCGGES